LSGFRQMAGTNAGTGNDSLIIGIDTARYKVIV
jgi:hypothetical protein